MRCLVICDPIERLNPTRDTTLPVMAQAIQRGAEAYWCEPHQLWLDQARLRAIGRRLVFDGITPRSDGVEIDIDCHSLNWVFMRKDPPYDTGYHHAVLMLEHLRGQVLVVNDPDGLRRANEKLYTLQFSEWMPRSIVSASPGQIRSFMESVGGRAVIKPLSGYAGRDIFILSLNDPNLQVIIESVTRYQTKPVMVQRYLPQAADGDKRILLLDGKPIGAVLRIPKGAGEHRGNLRVGGKEMPTTLTVRERELCQAIGPRLRKDGLYFVGIDSIGDHLTEINVTSPTGLQEINRTSGLRLEEQVVDWIVANCR